MEQFTHRIEEASNRRIEEAHQHLRRLERSIGLIVLAGCLVGFVHTLLKIAGLPLTLDMRTIVILLLFLGGIQLLAAGDLRERIGRVYEKVKKRPRFIVGNNDGFNASGNVIPEDHRGVERHEDKPA